MKCVLRNELMKDTATDIGTTPHFQGKTNIYESSKVVFRKTLVLKTCIKSCLPHQNARSAGFEALVYTFDILLADALLSSIISPSFGPSYFLIPWTSHQKPVRAKTPTKITLL